jgi:hypothetical protein
LAPEVKDRTAALAPDGTAEQYGGGYSFLNYTTDSEMKSHDGKVHGTYSQELHVN